MWCSLAIKQRNVYCPMALRYVLLLFQLKGLKSGIIKKNKKFCFQNPVLDITLFCRKFVRLSPADTSRMRFKSYVDDSNKTRYL